MLLPTILLLPIGGFGIGCVLGAIALPLRKAFGSHRVAGTVFFTSTLSSALDAKTAPNP